MMKEFVEQNDIKTDVKAKVSNWSSANKETKLQALADVLEEYNEENKDDEKGLRKEWVPMNDSNKKQKTF